MAILAVWCQGCDGFEPVAESLVESRVPGSTSSAVAGVSTSAEATRAVATSAGGGGLEAGDACNCVLGHAAVASAAPAVSDVNLAPADFADRPPATVLPAPEPPLRPPVA